MKLYQLTESYQNIWNLVDNEDTDLEAIEMALTSIETEIEAKAQNISVILKGMEYDASIIKTEEKRLSDRRRALENKITWLKGYLQEQMEAAGIDKIKTPTVTIGIQKNPPAVQITNQESIPSKYLTIIPEQYVPDKKAIKKALSNGENVPGAELTQGKSLRIR
jgi:hypothetical protein